MKDKGLAVIIGIGKPKGAMTADKASQMDDMQDKDGTYDDGNEDMDVCFPTPKGLSVKDGETVNLETTYEVKDGNLYPIKVNGRDIEANEDKEEAGESPEEEKAEEDGGEDLAAQRDKFRGMAQKQDSQLGYGG